MRELIEFPEGLDKQTETGQLADHVEEGPQVLPHGKSGRKSVAAASARIGTGWEEKSWITAGISDQHGYGKLLPRTVPLPSLTFAFLSTQNGFSLPLLLGVADFQLRVWSG